MTAESKYRKNVVLVVYFKSLRLNSNQEKQNVETYKLQCIKQKVANI